MSIETTTTTSLWWSSTTQQEQNRELESQNDVVFDETMKQKTEEEKLEAMFEKALTPSDVGKLNRLVIPKQHAEKYFPLDSEEIKGLLLSFEDESGKCWRFRYSYWNSSQSYVLTKGWSRYVKDKCLQSGDVVFFLRHRTHPKSFFISSSTRRHATHGASLYPAPIQPYPTHPHPFSSSSYHAGGGSQSQNITIPCGNNSSSSSTSRVLRLFGVNMECQPDNNIIINNHSQILSHDEEEQEKCSYNNMAPIPQFYHHHLHRQPSNPPHHHMLRQQPY